MHTASATMRRRGESTNRKAIASGTKKSKVALRIPKKSAVPSSKQASQSGAATQKAGKALRPRLTSAASALMPKRCFSSKHCLATPSPVVQEPHAIAVHSDQVPQCGEVVPAWATGLIAEVTSLRQALVALEKVRAVGQVATAPRQRAATELHVPDSDGHVTMKGVVAMTALSRSTIYALLKEGKFVQPIKMSKRAVRWDVAAIRAWIAKRSAVDRTTSDNLPAQS